MGASENLAKVIRSDVRKRDTLRLDKQSADGIFAGNDMLLSKPVSPEPLMEPEHESEILNPANDDAVAKLDEQVKQN